MMHIHNDETVSSSCCYIYDNYFCFVLLFCTLLSVTVIHNDKTVSVVVATYMYVVTSAAVLLQ